jgi:hypothetical protein
MKALIIAVGFIVVGASSAVAQAPQKRYAPAANQVPVARSTPTYRPAPRPWQPVPIARPIAPQRQAPIARPFVPQQQTPAARWAPAFPPARAVIATPRSPAGVIDPTRGAAHALSLRGAGRATIAGRNFSIWRGSYRVHRRGYWRTFVGLSALSAIMVGSAYYYPYAYIDAPENYCEGLTEDGCQLQWQEVQTLEGLTESQCVAYCPSQ